MKTKKTIKRIFVIFLNILLLATLLPISSEATTYHDEWADAWYYFSWMEEDGSWHEWIEISDENESILYSDLYLKVGQPVKCKIVTLTHIKSAISYWIKEPGVTKAFDVIEGEPHNEVIRFGVGEDGYYDWLEPETEVEYTWILQTNNNWTGGRAPLNGFCQVTPPAMDEDPLKIDISFANPYIENEGWTGPSYSSGDDDDDNGITNTNENNNKSTPGFEALFIVFALCVVLFIYRKR